MKIYNPRKFNNPKLKEAKKDIEIRNFNAKLHEDWTKSKHYQYVIGIISKWADEQDSIKRFSIETLTTSAPEEIKQTAILSKKIQEEAKELIRRLS